MRNLLDDLRFAARTLRNNPGYTAVAVATMALGIGASTTVFSWMDTVLLRPVPGVDHTEQLAALEGIPPDGGRMSSFTHPDFRDFQRDLKLASGVAATHPRFFTVGPADRAQRVMGQVVSANFFAVLGVRPYLGRMLLPSEDRDEPGAYPLAVISHRLWRAYFREDAGVIGRAVRVNGRPFTVVGVAPPEFRGTMGGVASDIWTPLSMIVQVGGLNTWAARDRNARFLSVIARLKPGVTAEQASSQARAVASSIAAAYPDTHRGISARVVPFWRADYGLQATLLNPLRILMIVCVLVLAIACANVANLLMVRSVARQKEFGVRQAMGAGRWRVVRQLLAEALVLAGAGAAVGLIAAQWMAESLHLVFPALDATVRAAVEPLLEAQVNGRVLLFTALVSAGVALVATVLPAMTASRVEVMGALKEGGRSGTASAGSHRLRGTLVVAEVALATMALTGAGLAIRSFQKVATIPPGFEPRNVLVAHFHLSTNGYSLQQEKQFCRDLRLRLETKPGIEAAACADAVPLSIFGPPSERVQVEDAAVDRSGVVSLPRFVVSPGYLRLMRIPLVAGRDFTDRDVRGSEQVIIVNQTFARRYFGDREPLGRKVRVSGALSTVVGVARDSKYRNPPEGPTASFYGPLEQMFWSGHNNFFSIRTSMSPEAAAGVLRREAAALGVGQGLFETAGLAEHTEAGLFAERVAAALL
ncbi:MAG TPA: ADOP family duplicated permease, partial [Bryobacteraceae bacterium]|nr:ADOP family duplicated permease [Bryobacteraceae bacterium]